MGFLAWIFLGLIAGFIASKIVNKRGAGMLTDVLLGIVGALVGGWIFTALGARGVSGFNLHSLIVATAGAVLILFTFHALRRTH
jgi:uncharacterized membrane protein YeaQ/YmgE (transglycosylase-associated protein family)